MILENKIPTDISVDWLQELKDATMDAVPCKRKWEIQDGGRQTGSKLEVLISQLPDQIATPLQRLTHIFGVQQLNGN